MTTDDPFEQGWRAVGLWLRYVLALFGDPGELMARGWIARSVRRKLLVFLRTAEAMARRLLWARAALMPASNAPPKARGVGGGFGGYGRGGFACADPSRWAVSFRLLTGRRPAARRRKRRSRAEPPGALAPTAPLAERLEALLRVCADPDRQARRLANRAHDARRRDPNWRPPLAAPPTRFQVETWAALAPAAPSGPRAPDSS